VKLIILIASGIGSVGKSSIKADLGFFLAQWGYQVIVTDLDFDGENLHNYLGFK
jgi:MinD-like ATPase involved in chromosome partitioning or flagellar assembly